METFDAHTIHCTYICKYTHRVRTYKQTHTNMHAPLVSLTECLICVGCELLVLLVDAVVGEVGEPVGEGLGGRGVPAVRENEEQVHTYC